MNWELLHKTYSRVGIVPVLGAGVSMCSRLPNWAELLERVGRSCLPRGGRRLVRDLRREGFSLPAIAGMLRALCPEHQNFAELVREELYRKFPRVLRQAKPGDWSDFVKFVQVHNPTLRAVAALCAIATDSQRPFRKNPLIHGIVNFNIDSVLREYVQARYQHALVRTVERPSKEMQPGRINVYYMHGFLRFDSKAGVLSREAADKLVLAEHEYFDFFNSPTGLFNYTFLYLLREHSCLFIGLSMQDDNVRRLLHYSTKERVQARVDEGKTSRDARSKAMRHFAVLKKYRSKTVNTAVERSLAQLGTYVLWISDYDEIPTRFGEMYAAAGHDWGSVY